MRQRLSAFRRQLSDNFSGVSIYDNSPPLPGYRGTAGDDQRSLTVRSLFLFPPGTNPTKKIFAQHFAVRLFQHVAAMLPRSCCMQR